jgi:hypothetical protein
MNGYTIFATDDPAIAGRLRACAPAGAHFREHHRAGWTLTTLAVPKALLPPAAAAALATRVSGRVASDPFANWFVFSRAGGELAAIAERLSGCCDGPTAA